jgi:hypothetical protein
VTPQATQLTKSTTYLHTPYGTFIALSTPKDMFKGLKLGIGKQPSVLVLAALLVMGALYPEKVHAEDRHTATARLTIQVNVIPTVVALQQVQQSTPQPSQAAVSFNLTPNSQASGNSTTQNVRILDKNASEQNAVLKTLTIVSE